MKHWEECKILVEEDLLLLASKTKSLSGLNSCQPVVIASQLSTPCQEFEESGLKNAQLARHQEGGDGGGGGQVGRGDIFLAELNPLTNPLLLRLLSSLVNKGTVYVNAKTPALELSCSANVNRSPTTPKVDQEVLGCQLQLLEDEIDGSLGCGNKRRDSVQVSIWCWSYGQVCGGEGSPVLFCVRSRAHL